MEWIFSMIAGVFFAVVETVMLIGTIYLVWKTLLTVLATDALKPITSDALWALAWPLFLVLVFVMTIAVRLVLED